MLSRQEAYLEHADIVIDTEGKTVDEVCAEIIEKSGFTL